ncbi:MAG: U32 family peptidase, partial [Fibrobacter sp.]|nr:U32 family peptidase [Fibrobacter sp.]
MNKIELLSPAGSFDIAETAFDYGADAVYVGIGQYNLRAHSPNFLPQDLPELMELAKKRGKLVYGAMNIMPNQTRLKEMEQMFAEIANNGAIPDAFIVSDPGV